MAFTSNNYQQLGLGDSTLRLSDRERKFLEESWAGAFARDIFPKIDEKLFAPLYSPISASPSNPVNVMVGAMILEELFDLSDDETVENLVCDVRFQYALHTTSEAGQPLSKRTMQRFRKRLNDDERENGRNLLHECFGKFHEELDAMIGQYFPNRKTDSVQIENAIRRIRAGEEFDPSVIDDPGTFKVHVLPAHSDHVVYASEEEWKRAEDWHRAVVLGETAGAAGPAASAGNPAGSALTGQGASDHDFRASTGENILKNSGNGTGAKADFAVTAGSSFRFSLNGLWKFSYSKNPASAVPGFEKLSFDCRSWDEIPVPAHLQMEGYDIPDYVNTQYPWDGREALKTEEVPKEFNPVGSYVKYFRLPERMKGKPVCISFQGVESGYAVWLNGNYVGYSEDTFSPSEFDLTPYLMEGENKLAVRVYKWTSSSWLEDQDFYRFSGIFRSVYLYTVPPVHVYDLKVRTPLNEACTEGELSVDLSVRFAGESGGAVDYRLLKEKEEVLSGHAELSEHTGIREKISSPLLWSAEDPELYDLFLSVKDGNGKEVEFIREKVGFRRFELKNGIMCLNGKRIVFKGVNRHEFTCDTGRAGMTEEVMRQDLSIMKRNNINAVRTCHYPDDCRLYRLCDELGLYLIAENNMETHGTWQAVEAGLGKKEDILPGDHREWEPALLDRVNTCYQEYKNHPAILIWSCGNESWGGSVIHDMSRKFRELDPDRLVHYEGIFHDRRYPDTSDMESQMYTPVSGIRKFLEEHPEKPFICCEYTHSMGNSNGGMFKYTELTETEPRYQGGFIWDFVDQSLRKRDRYGVEFQAYGGDCLERPTDYAFSGDGIVAGDRMPYPKLQEVKFLYQNISVRVEREQFTVINRNLFVSTDRFACVALLQKEGVTIAEAEVETSVPALSEKEYRLPFALPDMPGEYAVTVSFRLKENTLWAAAGYEIAFGQGVFRVEGKAGSSPEGMPGKTDSGMPAIIRGSYNIGVRGMDFDALFSFLNGSGLKSYRYGGREMVILPPRPNFWRAPTDNDRGNRMPARYGIWKLCSEYAADTRAEGPAAETQEEIAGTISSGTEDGVFVIRQRLFLPTLPSEKELYVTYRFYGDGTVGFILDYDADPSLPPMPEFGMLFTMDADYDRVTWYGNGPDETYCDRDKGARLGVYSGTVKEQMTRYLVPQECGNKTGVRWAKVTDRLGRGILFSVPEGQAMNFSALPWTPDEIENAAHHTELPPVHHTTVRCSLMQMGVAGDDTWGARTHEEFLLPNKGHLHFEVSMRGI